jgi:hypothetical protein
MITQLCTIGVNIINYQEVNTFRSRYRGSEFQFLCPNGIPVINLIGPEFQDLGSLGPVSVHLSRLKAIDYHPV